MRINYVRRRLHYQHIHRFWLTLFIALVLSLAVGTVVNAQEKDIQEYKVPVMQPEGIVYDKRTNSFYGGSSQPDGTVYRATLDGTVEVFMAPFKDGAGNFDNRTQTQGFNVDNEDRLYIAGGISGFLHVYQLSTGAKIAEFKTGVGSYINDVTIAKNGDVYFTDSNLPFIYRVTKEQVESGSGIPQAISLEPPVKYTDKSTDTNPLEANGIRATPDGRYIIFGSLNDHRLYRLTPPNVDPKTDPVITPNEREIVPLSIAGSLGDIDGLEFLNLNTLYVVENEQERIVKVRLSDDFLQGNVQKQTTSNEFRTPTGISLAPNGRLLVTNAEFFDVSEPGPPYYVLSIPQP